ncbi:hypothetical protein ACFLYB_04555 [Chloroflexota bacterium]
MSTPKIVAVVLMSLLLVFCLSIFGWLFTTKMTALNAGYITSKFDNLPIAALVEDTEFEDAFGDNPQLAELVKSLIIENETELKLRASEAIDTFYDYFHGRSQHLDLALVLKDTVLDPDFAISIVNQADLVPLAEELMGDMLSEAELPYGLSLEPHIEKLADDTEPWLKQQVTAAIPPLFDYILGFSQQADIIISVEDLRNGFKDILRQDFLDMVPAEFSGLTQVELKQKYEEIFNEFGSEIPVEFKIGTDHLQLDISQFKGEIKEALDEARRYIGVFNIVFSMLIGFILLLIGTIVLLFRQVKGATFTLGIVFLFFGFINLILVSIARSAATSGITRGIQNADAQLPAAFEQWLTQLASGSLAPLFIMAIVLFIIGTLLLAVSFLYPRYRNQRQAETSF